MNKFSRIIAAICSAALMSGVAVVPAAAASAIEYSFVGDEAQKAGYAEGKITLNMPDGTYYLYWADDKKALDGYYEIAEVEVKSGKGEFSFSDHNAIPVGATKLIAVKNKNTTDVKSAEAVYDIPKSKILKYTADDANYTFMNYSDIHIDQASSVFYRHSELHWEKALETAAKRKADFIVTAGDNITNAEGPAKEFDKYQQILADSLYTNPIYEGSGNHELRQGKKKEALKTFITATGLDGSRDTIAENKPYYYVEEPNTGDLFIFMALEYKYSPDEGDEFSDEQLEWFENLLREHYGKNRNIYLIQHALIEGYGAGDDEDNYYTVPLGTEYESTVKFRDIIQKYPDLIWISGHTHIALKYGYNYSNMSDTSCNMIHDSSVCCPTLLNYSSHKLSYAANSGEEYEDFTEGYYVQVFDDEVIFNGENLYHDMIYPTACYIMESCRQSAPEKSEKTEIPEEKSVNLHVDRTALGVYAQRVFTMPKSFECKNITPDDVLSLRERAKRLLDNLYTFSSYDDYQKLKSEYYMSALSSNPDSAYKTLSEAYLGLLPYCDEGKITVYLSNTKGWDKVYAKLWSLKSDNGDGQEMTYVGEDENKNKIYKITLNCHQYNHIQFTDGTAEEYSEEQVLTGGDNTLYRVNALDPIAPYFCYENEYK
ncbi:MAG: metallophosphoesterase [Ruminococcus sp.]|nr:metallophosphoesterase [Ruminococcus sp.]